MREEQDHSVQLAVEKYHGPLINYATRLLGNQDQARDVVQDAFLRFLRAKPSVNGQPGPWLYKVTRNRALDVLKKERRMTAITQDDLPAVSTPADPLEQVETQDTVTKLLDALPGNQ